MLLDVIRGRIKHADFPQLFFNAANDHGSIME